MISLKNNFLLELETPRLRQVIIVQDQGALNIKPQMPAQLTYICCQHGTMYGKQYLMIRLQFFESFVTTALQFHTYKGQQI